MLLILGGAARSGKSIIARQIVADCRIPYFSLDYLAIGLAKGWPDAGIDLQSPSSKIAAAMWPLLRAMAINIIEVGADYLLEGDTIEPAHAAELAERYPGKVKACFVGYPDATLANRIRTIEANSNFPNNWLTNHDRNYIENFIAAQIEYSRFIQSECARTGFPFLDVDSDFKAALRLTIGHLTACRT